MEIDIATLTKQQNNHVDIKQKLCKGFLLRSLKAIIYLHVLKSSIDRNHVYLYK